MTINVFTLFGINILQNITLLIHCEYQHSKKEVSCTYRCGVNNFKHCTFHYNYGHECGYFSAISDIGYFANVGESKIYSMFRYFLQAFEQCLLMSFKPDKY